MNEISAYAKETKLREDFWLFLWSLTKHWHVLITVMTGLGIITLLSWCFPIPPWIVPWVAAIGIAIAAFFAWRDVRDSNLQISKDLSDLQDQIRIAEVTAKQVKSMILVVELEDQKGIDMELSMRIYRVKVTNLHPSRTIDNVRVYLEHFSGGVWESSSTVDQTAIAVRKLRLPHQLPVSRPTYNTEEGPVFNAQLNAGCSVFFDLFSARAEGGVTLAVGLPPFIRESKEPFFGKGYNFTIYRPTLEFSNGLWGMAENSIDFGIIASAMDTEAVKISSRLNCKFKDREEKCPWMEIPS